MINVEGIDVAAQLAVLGLDPLDFLYTRDSFKRALVQQLAQRIQHYQEVRDHNLAVQIANQVGRLFKS